MAGFVPHAVSSLVNGGYGSPAYGSVVLSASGGAIPIAGFPDSAGAPQGVAGVARGTCPTNGSRVPAPPGVVHPPQVDQAPELARPVVANIVRS